MSEYPHEHDWEIPPEERTREKELRTPYRDGGSMRDDTTARQNKSRSESKSKSLLWRFVRAIVEPIFGFVLLATISLAWSGFVFALLMAWTAMGHDLTGTALLLSALFWMVGFRACLVVLYHGDGA